MRWRHRLLVALLALLSTTGWSMGRKPSYVNTGQDDIQPVKRGSAANPVAAFAPPTFEAYQRRPAPAPVTVRSTVNKTAAQVPPPTNDGMAAPGGAPISEHPAPPPKAVPTAATPSDAGVPALPDYSNEQNQPAPAAAPTPVPPVTPTKKP